jgi:hypothetical protein
MPRKARKQNQVNSQTEVLFFFGIWIGGFFSGYSIGLW